MDVERVIMMTLVGLSIVVLALSGVPALILRDRIGERLSALLVLSGAAIGLVGAVHTLLFGGIVTMRVTWALPGTALALRLDPLAAAFLLPTFVLGAVTTVYGLAYWPASEQTSAVRVRLFSGLLLASMAAVVVAGHGIVFLFAWEAMALSAFFLIAANDTDGEVRAAAWTYLIATHIGTLALFALFVMLQLERGTFLLGPISSTAGVGTCSVIFALAIIGFGFKAGIVPFHFWLPAAHANAPSHVSALLSGAMLKVGVYGLLRIVLLMPRPQAWWGAVLIVIGLETALVAIVLATTQTDMKRTLAYSSIENVGVIVTAVGVALLGRATGTTALAMIGLAAAVAHVWSHSLFKGLLFLGAGSVLHATGTRRIDALGGLLRRMPTTGATFIIAAAAAATLPGTNAFVSEALLYVGLFGTAPAGSVVILSAAALALVGAIALACFIRLMGTIFLGTPRTTAAEDAHEAPMLMRAPLLFLGALCVLLGVVPVLIARPLETIVGTGIVTRLLLQLSVPLGIAAIFPVIVTALLIAATRRSPRAATWDCGYAAPSARMQYTSRSFGEWLGERLTPRFLQPPMRRFMPAALFPTTATFATDIDEPFADRLYRPIAARWRTRAMRLRWLQQGRLPLYLLYILVTLIAGIGWAVVFPLLGGQP